MNNMQAMVKQAQKLQKEMMETQSEINNKTFVGKSSIVTVKINGKKEIEDLKIDSKTLENDDIELLEDMIVVAINDAMKQIDSELENKMGKYTKGIPGLF